jgi:hypothetical protein
MSAIYEYVDPVSCGSHLPLYLLLTFFIIKLFIFLSVSVLDNPLLEF